MSAFRSAVVRLPVKVLLGWLVASMVGWLGVAVVGLAIERAVYAVPLTAIQVISVVGGMEGIALVLALTIFALVMLIAGADASPAHARPHRAYRAWATPLSASREPAIVPAVGPRWRATVLQ